MNPISWLAGSSLRLLVSFAAVIAVLALLDGLPSKFRGWEEQAQRSETSIAILSALRDDFGSLASEAIAQSDREMDELKRAGSGVLKARVAQMRLEREKAEANILTPGGMTLALARGQADRVRESYRAEYLTVPLLDRALALTDIRLQNLVRRASWSAQRSSLARDLAQYKRRVSIYRAAQRERATWAREASAELRNPLCRRVALPAVCKKARKVRARDIELQRWSKMLKADERKLIARKRALGSLSLAREQAADVGALLAEANARFEKDLDRLRLEALSNPSSRVRQSLHTYGWQASLIVLGAILLPPLHKAVVYFVLAPLAHGARPVTLRSGTSSIRAGRSQTTLDVPIDAKSELLLRGGAQDRPTGATVRDVPVLSWRMPLTSLASGLYGLQRFRSETLDHVTVSSVLDHGEVALVEIPVGAAAVIQPRSVVGLVRERRVRSSISRPWRIGFQTSWLTFQFRYVVFHGPCKLIVQGRRGVLSREAETGRAINKRLTLGFDTRLAYGAERAASFLPFLSGRASLYDDRFEGTGVYLYEQQSTATGKGSLWGRGLKGIGDALLSAFGI